LCFKCNEENFINAIAIYVTRIHVTDGVIGTAIAIVVKSTRQT
jgi:hypothetical protein